MDIGRTPIVSKAALPSWCGSDVKTNRRGQGIKALASAVSIHLFDFALCFLPLRKLPLALFTIVVFPYLRDEEAGKGFYDGLWKFNFTICSIGLIFWQGHFPFPKRRTRSAGGRKHGKGKLFPPARAGYQFTPRMARISLFSRRLFMYSSKQVWGQPLSS